MIGAAVDYLANATNEAFNRESFVAANEEALDATIATWKAGLEANIDTAIDKWFDDARAGGRSRLAIGRRISVAFPPLSALC